MIEFERSPAFADWLDSMKDTNGKARIIARIRGAEHGNMGDCEFVGSAVYEMRVHYGPGYRMYFTRKGEVIYLLLLGGRQVDTKTRYQTRHPVGAKHR
jgi:putative addiction module killer protein